MRSEFFEVCNRSEPARRVYVSLYVSVPYYGGPEEGGWWGNDTQLVASQAFSNESQAEAARDRVEHLAKQMSDDARRAYGDQCRAETEWLGARGIDDSFLPEVDGESRYFVAVEDREGSQESQGCRQYC